MGGPIQLWPVRHGLLCSWAFSGNLHTERNLPCVVRIIQGIWICCAVKINSFPVRYCAVKSTASLSILYWMGYYYDWNWNGVCLLFSWYGNLVTTRFKIKQTLYICFILVYYIIEQNWHTGDSTYTITSDNINIRLCLSACSYSILLESLGNTFISVSNSSFIFFSIVWIH